MNSERIEIVNQQGTTVGHATRQEAYEQGLLHRAVTVVVINSKGEIYLQQRSLQKDALPMYWDISVAEHPKPGESYEDAARRGMREELSIDYPTDPRLLRGLHPQTSEFEGSGLTLRENELVQLYVAFFDGEIVINPEEVCDGKFVSPGELQVLIGDSATRFTPWGIEELSYILQHPEAISR
ncbi:MAG: NUDIX domain-containing protein [Candidatus Curtissbacteria bacterium]